MQCMTRDSYCLVNIAVDGDLNDGAYSLQSNIASCEDCFAAESWSTNVTCPTIRLRRSADWMAFCRRRI